MPDDTDVIVSALTERFFQSLEETRRDHNLSRVLGLASLSLLVRRQLVTAAEAIEEIEAVVSALPPSDREGIDERVDEAIEILKRVISEGETIGPIVDGEASGSDRRG